MTIIGILEIFCNLSNQLDFQLTYPQKCVVENVNQVKDLYKSILEKKKYLKSLDKSCDNYLSHMHYKVLYNTKFDIFLF